MERVLVFTHRLDLALRLVDTTSGANVPGAGICVRMDGKRVWFAEKRDHLLIFQGLEKRAFRMEVSSPSFEPLETEVDLDALDQAQPLLELHLVPGRDYPGGVDFFTVEGRLPGIGELSAVPLGENNCLIREFDPRRRIAKIFNPHHLSLDRVGYALVDPDHNRFEPFRILRSMDDQTLKIDRILETEFKNYFPIVPQVQGITRPDGSYCLRVRDNGERAKWLLRWVRDGDVCFRFVDFRETPAPRLEEGGE